MKSTKKTISLLLVLMLITAFPTFSQITKYQPHGVPVSKDIQAWANGEEIFTGQA